MLLQRFHSHNSCEQGVQSSGTADQQQARMMAYDITITSFNTARLSGVAYPLLRNLMEQTDPVSETYAPNWSHLILFVLF